MTKSNSFPSVTAFLTVLSRLLASGICVPIETYHDNNPLCDCYVIDSGGTPTYFHNFRFYDFRHYAHSPTDYKTEPALVTTPGGNEAPTSSVFSEPPFINDWGVQSWGIGPTSPGLLPRWNSPQNVYLGKSLIHGIPIGLANICTRSANERNRSWFQRSKCEDIPHSESVEESNFLLHCGN
jgi:hypothetical protein